MMEEDIESKLSQEEHDEMEERRNHWKWADIVCGSCIVIFVVFLFLGTIFVIGKTLAVTSSADHRNEKDNDIRNIDIKAFVISIVFFCLFGVIYCLLGRNEEHRGNLWRRSNSSSLSHGSIDHIYIVCVCSLFCKYMWTPHSMRSIGCERDGPFMICIFFFHINPTFTWEEISSLSN